MIIGYIILGVVASLGVAYAVLGIRGLIPRKSDKGKKG
jgi:hypothetical protein